MQTYEEMLEDALKKVKAKDSGERFEIPVIESLIEGNRTIIRNFMQVCDILKRDQNHLLKFLTRETAAPGSIDGQRAILQAKIPNKVLQSKLNNYIRDYVICKECGRPDTKLIKEDRITFLKCEACGARGSV